MVVKNDIIFGKKNNDSTLLVTFSTTRQLHRTGLGCYSIATIVAGGQGVFFFFTQAHEWCSNLLIDYIQLECLNYIFPYILAMCILLCRGCKYFPRLCINSM